MGFSLVWCAWQDTLLWQSVHLETLGGAIAIFNLSDVAASIFSTWSPSHNYKYPNFSKKSNVWSSHWRWLTKLEILCKREPFFNFTTNRNKSQYCEPLTGCTWTQQMKPSVGLGNLRWFRTLSGRLSESQVRAYPKRFMGLWLIWL